MNLEIFIETNSLSLQSLIQVLVLQMNITRQLEHSLDP